jgi:hypothetical protein
MRIKEVLPNLYEVSDKGQLLWNQELAKINLFELNEMIGIRMEDESRQGPDRFKAIARSILEDFLIAKENVGEEERKKLNFLQYIHCTEAARYFSSRGIFTESHDWLVYSLSEDLNYLQDTIFYYEWIHEFLISKDNFIALNAISSILEWIDVLFYYSRHHGGLYEFAKEILQTTCKIVLVFLNEKVPPGVNELKVVQAACQVLAWTISYQNTSAQNYAIGLSNYFSKTTNRIVKKMIAFQLAVGGAEHTNKTSNEWAEIVLSGFSDLIVGHERMQLLAKYYSENLEKLIEQWENFSGAIKDYLSTLKNVQSLSLKYEKARLFSVISGLLRSCIEKGHVYLANNIIREFYGMDKTRGMSDQQLYLICNYEYGVLYASQNDKIIAEGEGPLGFVQVVQQTNLYLSSTIALNNFPDFELVKPQQPGVPVIDEGGNFEKALNKHYQLERLSNSMLNRIDSMIIIPGFQHPIQSMMIKELNATVPICVSFEKPKERRKIQKVLVWCFGTRTSELEMNLTTKMFESLGVVVEAINILEVKRDDFILKYKSSEYDLIWIGTHGNYNHFLPHLSKIDIHPDGEIELSELFGLAPSTDGQRMLFLNICDGATASTLNAVYDIGLGASLCDANQSVLSHIWMVRLESSLIYGALYAHFIITGDNVFSAYENVVKCFLKGKEHIKEVLSPYNRMEEELVEYVDRLNEDINNNIYYWGSGVYYQ